MLGFDAVRRRRDAEEERGTKTRRVGLGKGKEGRSVFRLRFFYLFILAYCGGKRKLLVFFHLGPFIPWFYDIISFLMVVTFVGTNNLVFPS